MNTPYAVGTVVPSRFDGGLVAASYFASLCGCLVTIEILHRRGTAIKSWRSWLESFSCATSMGLVGVWCMHFIGNRAIILGNIDANVEQLSYGIGFTILSVFLPVIGLTVAFSTAEMTPSSTIQHWIALICAGTFAGLSVVGMHYVGNLGVRNYHLIYNRMYILASILIAVGDCLAVLVLFYNLREQWINLWWRRFMCAVLLSGGISTMHFVGSTNCRYIYVRSAGPNANASRNTQVIVAGALCGATALVLFIGMLLIRRNDRTTQRRSQKVMLSCAMFCPEGRVLVTPGGILPSREITDKFNHRTFDEDFDTAHPVFQWIFRVSRNWSGVVDLIPKMKSHLGAQRDSANESRLTSSQSSAVYDSETYRDYEVIFRERFCSAAASIAASIHLPIDKLGVIYDKIIETGILTPEEKTGRRLLTRKPAEVDVEAALRQSVFGKGQLMLLTRVLTNDEVRKLENVGFKFAFVEHVGRNIAHAMQIPQPILDAHFARLRHYVRSRANAEKTGTWLSCFAMIPKPNGKGFDIAVKKESPDQLPDVALLLTQPTQWQSAILDQLGGLRVSQIASMFDDSNGKYGSRLDSEARQFVDKFHQAMLSLMLSLPKEWTSEARFWSKQLCPHYSPSSTTTLYAFTVMGNMHAHLACDGTISRVPRTFFETRHRCYPGSPDHALLTKEIHAMFAPLFAKKIAKDRPYGRLGKLSNAISGSISGIPKLPHPGFLGRSSSSSEQSMIERRPDGPTDEPLDQSRGEKKKYENNDLGGILVDSKTMVKTDSKVITPCDSSEPMKHLGSVAAVSIVKPEKTFVDELVEITKARFMPASTRSNSY